MAEFTGGCLCGAIRYKVTGDPVRVQICHCDDCRRATGSNFATNVFIHTNQFKLLLGMPKTYQHAADSGNMMTKEFCGECGAPIGGYNSRSADMRIVKVGSIDDASFVQPDAEVFVSQALPFTLHFPHTEKFEFGRSR